MNFSGRFLLIAIPVSLSVCALAWPQGQNEVQPAKQGGVATPGLPKSSACPAPPGTAGVSLRIITDTKGNVTEVKALAGNEKFFPAAETCAKTWKYENPPATPLTKSVFVSFYSRECPGPESQRGEVQWSWGLRDKRGEFVAYLDGEQPPPPSYPDEERKAGVAGGMVLSLSLDDAGYVKEIHVTHGLSPRLDKSIVDLLRPLKFKLLDSDSQTKNLRFDIVFHATCAVQSVTIED